MLFTTLRASLFSFLALASPTTNRAVSRNDDGGDRPYLPWSTSGRDVVNSKGEAVTVVGVNWPGHSEAMIPEGLQYTSAKSIVDRLATAGFNFVRHTYAVEMIDDIYEGNMTDVSLQTALNTALGSENGTRILGQILQNNADMNWSSSTTRLEVLHDIAMLEHERGIVMHLDNQVSKAMWCCSHTDGNAWFGDIYFGIENWRRSLSYMASWAAKQPNVPSMSLRNELRSSANDTSLQYQWVTWAGNMTAGADAIHQANSDLLITFSGLQFDQDLSVVTNELNVNVAPAYQIDAIRDGKRIEPVYFRLDDHDWHDKAVLELHLYDMSANVDTGSCDATLAELYRSGCNGLGIDPPKLCATHPTDVEQYECHKAKRLVPVWLTEFGQAQDATLYNSTLMNCLRQFTEEHSVGWAIWSLAGSYYTRQGTQDLDDTWALMNHMWSDWRDPSTFDGFWRPWIKTMGKIGLEKSS